jgi:putative membrane protein insertion efficiency factor
VTRFRRVLWIAGTPARAALLGAIALYRSSLSGAFAGSCRFSPGCSRYAAEAIRVHGAIVGSVLALRRVLRCNPFGRGGLDPVPARRAYDVIVQFGGRARAR